MLLQSFAILTPKCLEIISADCWSNTKSNSISTQFQLNSTQFQLWATNTILINIDCIIITRIRLETFASLKQQYNYVAILHWNIHMKVSGEYLYIHSTYGTAQNIQYKVGRKIIVQLPKIHDHIFNMRTKKIILNTMNIVKFSSEIDYLWKSDWVTCE